MKKRIIAVTTIETAEPNRMVCGEDEMECQHLCNHDPGEAAHCDLFDASLDIRDDLIWRCRKCRDAKIAP